MKRINRIFKVFLALAVVGMANTGCKKYFEDYVVTPNDPADVTPGLLLTSTQIATFANYGGQFARQSGVMIQHVAGTSAGSQTVEIATYNLTELTNENEWDVIYAGAIMNSNILINEYGAESPYYSGIAKVIKAMNAGLATDLFGDVPLSDASGGQTGNLAPTYDTQESVIQQIQTMLDEAIVELSMDLGDNKFVPTTDDLIFNGDPAMWIKTAYGLKARYANRLSQRDAGGSAAAALAALPMAMQSTADDCNMIFGSGNSQNQWSAYEGSRGGYIRVSETFVDSLFNTSDPRLEAFVGKDVNDSISGTPFDDVNVVESSFLSSLYASPASSIPLVSYVEMKFIEAEAKLRNADGPGAAIAHNEAVAASILQTTGAADPAYEALYANEDGNSITLEKIMYQKWVALFAQLEAFADWRRTGFPMLTANPNGLTPQIPLRFITPQQERLYNPNAKIQGDMYEPVWWDN